MGGNQTDFKTMNNRTINNRATNGRMYVVIPARLHSTRLPRKMLLRETGKTLIEHTYRAVVQARGFEGVCVATDHDDIAREVRSFGGDVRLTNPQAASGTDRVAEVATDRADIEIFVNVQGDEPEIDPRYVEQVAQLLIDHPDVPMATLATPIRSETRLHDPNCVKVVRNDQGAALYFSRSPIPHARDGAESFLSADPPVFLHHLGIYAYRRDFLLRLPQLPLATLENIEKLEQLRVLAAGYAIQVGLVSSAPVGIDTLDDYRAFVSRTVPR